MSAEQVYMIPPGAPDPLAGRVGVSLGMPFGVLGRLPQRTPEDATRSVKKHIAEILDERGGAFLLGIDALGAQTESPSWEVRLWDDEATFRYPFAKVIQVGPDSVAGRLTDYADVTQSVMVHLYPAPTADAERGNIQADRLRSMIQDALVFGAGRFGRPGLIPMWDFGGASGTPDDPFGIYQDTEERQSWDYMRVEGLTTEKMQDPADDRHFWVVVNFRVRWRRVPSLTPGLLVQSVRVTTHPD